jgi:uncharacterized membrane protein SpoIIM required for sporulation
MNIERWITSRRNFWHKLEELLNEIDKNGLSSLKSDALQSLGKLYRLTSADLSRARALNLSSEVTIYLNNLVVKAHNQVYQRKHNRWLDIWNFFFNTFPQLVQENFIYVGISFCLFVIPMAASWSCEVQDRDFGNMEFIQGKPIIDDELWSYIENRKLWTDSVSGMSPLASSFIATNNIKVSILAFALGITFGAGTVFVLVQNGIFLGTVFGACQLYGLAPALAAFVSGHGVLELSSIFISGGAGLMIARALLFPGMYSRVDALRRYALPAFHIFVGCVPLLLIAGAIEGFISPRVDISPEAKYMVSFATFVCLLLYLFVPRNKA